MRNEPIPPITTPSELEMAALDFIQDANLVLTYALQSEQHIIQPPAAKSKKH